jgi:HAD domain in Swiss Army Knife RNA repair proteins
MSPKSAYVGTAVEPASGPLAPRGAFGPPIPLGWADVVVSSHLAIREDGRELQEMLQAAGFTGRVIDTAPISAAGTNRGAEIRAWLVEHAVNGYMIVDDHVDMGELRQHLIITQLAHGLSTAEPARGSPADDRSTNGSDS